MLAAPPPVVDQLVVLRSGRAVERRVSTKSTAARVGHRRCAVPARTALAALLRSRPARVRLHDFGTCSRRASDAAGLFVSAIGADRNGGQAGWVYKVGRKAATAGAADPKGPFGRGRLRGRDRVTWFYCRKATSCQRTLEILARGEAGAVSVTVRGYDDQGRGVAIGGATVHAGSTTAATGADGHARLPLRPGSYRLFAEKQGLVRSFRERVTVR